MLEVLRDLSNHEKKWVSQRAQMALALAEQYEGGWLEDSEYMELMNRVVEDSKLDREADDLETKAMLITAVHEASGII